MKPLFIFIANIAIFVSIPCSHVIGQMIAQDFTQVLSRNPHGEKLFLNAVWSNAEMYETELKNVQSDSTEYEYEFYLDGTLKKLSTRCVGSPALCGLYITFFPHGGIKTLGRYIPLGGSCSQYSLESKTIDVGVYLFFEKKIGYWIQFDESGRIISYIDHSD